MTTVCRRVAVRLSKRDKAQDVPGNCTDGGRINKSFRCCAPAQNNCIRRDASEMISKKMHDGQSSPDVGCVDARLISGR